MGDFISVMYPLIEPLLAPTISTLSSSSALAKTILEPSLIDLWWSSNPVDSQFSWFSKTFMTLSKIDMALVNS